MQSFILFSFLWSYLHFYFSLFFFEDKLMHRKIVYDIFFLLYLPISLFDLRHLQKKKNLSTVRKSGFWIRKGFPHSTNNEIQLKSECVEMRKKKIRKKNAKMYFSFLGLKNLFLFCIFRSKSSGSIGDVVWRRK